ncbi:MAG: helix-turn-helix domain-containing protein [Peptostreptococcaceae bacterium]|nr:helix-turn-helix domain-containing protein [Peptostreptococcaceae bacterium]
MIVSELLSLPLFSNFRILNKPDGMNNEILGTSIFDWETREDVEKTFSKGDFVLTTLAKLKTDQNFENTLDAIFSIFDKEVAVVSIKKTFEFVLPEEVLDYANSKGIPVFVFEDTYMDDIIYVIKSTLITNSLNDINLEKLKDIMKLNYANSIRKASLSINKYFYANYVVCVCMPKANLSEDELSEHFAFFKKAISTSLEKTDTMYTIITGKKSFFVIITFSNDTNASTPEQIRTALNPLNYNKQFSIGLSNISYNLENFKLTVTESVFASLISILNNSTIERFSDLKSDQMFFPNVFNNRGKTFYEDIDNMFNEHDTNHSSDFKKTLLTYVKNNGNINDTAIDLYQHPNTVRYRIKKIKELLKIEDSYESAAILYSYSRLDSIYSIISKCELPIIQD